ncbi:MAG TPA: hypothetical protein VMT30_00200 [Candidatus Saccharimonadia bacterium]|nr:hypothetical protein [Candidatus Saccharimonadia bacterium]
MKLGINLDVRRPVHAVVMGVLLAGMVAPVADWLVTNERYRMTPAAAAVAERPSPALMSKLRYDKDKHASVFNAEGQADAWSDPKDKLQMAVGAGGKKDTQLYSATLPDNPAQGVEVHDNVNDVSVKFVPQVALMEGRSSNGQVTYPLKDAAGQMMFTPKGNGLKEDIVLTSAPKADAMEFHYRLDIPDTVEARLEDDGSVGFYTASPELYGNVSYGSDNDREMLDKARVAGAKTYLMFAIPAPVVRETGQRSAVSARFGLSGKDLVVRARGLAKANYPLSIDPTFLLRSTADFVLGSVDDNIDLTSVADQIGRAPLSGGSVVAWTTGTNITVARYAGALVAYNNFVYLIGGGADSGTATTPTNVVYSASIGAAGALTWTGTSTNQSLNTARQGLVAFGYNGYLYAVGGENTSNNPIATVEYAKINSDGSVGTWSTTTSLGTARAYMAGANYQGVVYVMGGEGATSNGSLLTSVEYARINGDGTITSWTTTTALGTARDRFSGAAYNGFVYVTGGRTGTPTVLSTVEYAPIKSDGTLGSWISTTAFPTARRDHGVAVERGHIYVYGGCRVTGFPCGAASNFISDTQYAVLNADGSVGEWQQSNDYTGATAPERSNPSSAFYNGYLYFVGGCTIEISANQCDGDDPSPGPGVRGGTFKTNLDNVGRFDNGMSGHSGFPFDSNSTTARMGGKGVALNGYMYYIGGCSTANNATCNNTYSSLVEYAQINANGSMGAFASAGNVLIGNGTNKAGRIGHMVVGYNNKIYVIGGVEYTTGNVDSYQATVQSATQASNGTLGTFTMEANALPGALAFGYAAVWHNMIFVMGGLSNGTTVATTIYKSTIASNAPGAWATAKLTSNPATAATLANARWDIGGGQWGNWLYVVGGMSTSGGTYVTTAHATERIAIDNSGNLTIADLGTLTGAFASRGMGMAVHNGYLYSFGGYNTGSTTQQATIRWTKLDPTTGSPTAPDAGNVWAAANIGQATTLSYTKTDGQLSTARGETTAVATGGYMYIMGGCAGTLAAGTFKQCATAFVTTANTTELYEPNNGGNGQTGAFTTGTGNVVDLPTVGGTAGRADHASVAYNGKLYVIGGCRVYTTGACSTGLGDIERADIDPGGKVTGSWTAQTSLPSGEVRSSLQAVAYNGYLYVIGGKSASSGATATVWYTTIDSTGTLGGSWTNADLPAGTDRTSFGAAIARGYLFVAGGDNGSGTKKSDVYYAAINTSTGGLGTWTLNTTGFTTARSGFSLVSYNGKLYVIGGTDGTNNLLDVQFGTVAADGSIASWSYTTDVARGMVARQAVAANGYMYFVGDEGSTAEVLYVDINANGTLGTTQHSANAMSGAHAHGAAALFGGVMYVTGGCVLSAGVCTTVSAANDRAGQFAIARTGHYSKLFNTEVDTSPSQLVLTGSLSGPESKVAVRFYTEQASATQFGVAQVFDPVIFNNFYGVQPLDSSGANTGVAFNYLIVLVLDDSLSGTFPDVATSAETNVSEIDLYYHANPTRRLRHGAAFTNTGCNATPANGCILDTAP